MKRKEGGKGRRREGSGTLNASLEKYFCIIELISEILGFSLFAS
jgi:hypothetical protein